MFYDRHHELALVTAAAIGQDVPKAIPPSFTFGHEIFNSIPVILSNGNSFSATSTYPSTVESETLDNYVCFVMVQSLDKLIQ